MAAGSGERMGGVAKPLIRIAGEPLIVRLIAALRAAGANEIVLVLGHHAEAVQQVLRTSGLATHVNVAHLPALADQSVSLQTGLAALVQRVESVMVCLADQPLVDAAAIVALRDAYLARPAACDWVMPWVDGQPGNPVVMSRAVAIELRDAIPPVSGKSWRERHAQRVSRWVSANNAYVCDLDTPADVAALRARAWVIDLPQARGSHS